MPPIEVSLQDDAGFVEGSVTSANDLPGITVLFVQPHGDRNLIQNTRSMGGKFWLSPAPGEYAVLAFRDSDEIEYQNPAVLSPYLSRAAHVTVQAKVRTNMNVSVSPVTK